MLSLILSFFLFNYASYSVGTGELNSIRHQFHQAALDEKHIPPFHTRISVYPVSQPIIIAYKAAAEALVAQETWNPVEKYQQLIKFEQLMSEAIRKDPGNLEIRFIRFSVQYYIPRFLGFSNDLYHDKEFIAKNLDGIRNLGLDPNFTHYIIYFLRETGFYNEESLNQIESKLAMK